MAPAHGPGGGEAAGVPEERSEQALTFFVNRVACERPWRRSAVLIDKVMGLGLSGQIQFAALKGLFVNSHHAPEPHHTVKHHTEIQ